MKHIILTAELIKEEEGGYTVYCPELDIHTQGEDVEDAIKNLKEAAELHMEELGISPISSLCHCEYKEGRRIPQPTEKELLKTFIEGVK